MPGPITICFFLLSDQPSVRPSVLYRTEFFHLHSDKSPNHSEAKFTQKVLWSIAGTCLYICASVVCVCVCDYLFVCTLRERH